MSGDWLPPQSPGGQTPPPVPPDTPPPAPPFEPRDGPNNDAVAAITCGVAGAGLLVWTNGLSTLVSLTLGIVGVVYAARARRNVAEGRTKKHADMAVAARIAGWITVGISLIATTVWTLLLVFADPL